jgi:NAD(P)-dependent dehydrogenase (short-subunit alcohol dehydrogenase family)
MGSSTPTWLITGCSSGFGFEIAQVALRAGHNVIATSRTPSKTPDAVSVITSTLNGKWLALDVTASQDSIVKTMAEAESLFGPIDILVNNAACAVLGAAEEVPEEVTRKEYETNYWGAVEDHSSSAAKYEEEEEWDDRECKQYCWDDGIAHSGILFGE